MNRYDCESYEVVSGPLMKHLVAISTLALAQDDVLGEQDVCGGLNDSDDPMVMGGLSRTMDLLWSLDYAHISLQCMITTEVPVTLLLQPILLLAHHPSPHYRTLCVKGTKKWHDVAIYTCKGSHAIYRKISYQERKGICMLCGNDSCYDLVQLTFESKPCSSPAVNSNLCKSNCGMR